jgi:hypothetical protein
MGMIYKPGTTDDAARLVSGSWGTVGFFPCSHHAFPGRQGQGSIFEGFLN